MAHIMDARVGLVPTGWECPRCHYIYAPLTAECWRCAPPAALEWARLAQAVPPKDGDDRLTVHLPPYMAAENGSQRAGISRTWSEVFPGLQCRLHRAIWTCSPDGEPTGADIEFRLVPEEERGHG